MIQKYKHSIWTGDEPTRLFEPLPAKYQLASLSNSMRAIFCNYEGKQVQHSGYFQKQFLGGFEALIKCSFISVHPVT